LGISLGKRSKNIPCGCSIDIIQLIPYNLMQDIFLEYTLKNIGIAGYAEDF
jgi:hypothetical protein